MSGAPGFPCTSATPKPVPGDQPLYISDTSRFETLTGWKPRRALTDILDDDPVSFWHENRDSELRPTQHARAAPLFTSQCGTAYPGGCVRYALVNPNWSFDGSTYFGCREPHFPLELAFGTRVSAQLPVTRFVLLIDACRWKTCSRRLCSQRLATRSVKIFSLYPPLPLTSSGAVRSPSCACPGNGSRHSIEPAPWLSSGRMDRSRPQATLVEDRRRYRLARGARPDPAAARVDCRGI